MTSTKQIKNIVELITGAIKVKEIILFGSYAYGNPDKNSDIDLCIITEEKKRKIELVDEIRQLLLRKVHLPLDILVYSPEEFKERANWLNSMEKTIAQKGVVLYA